MSVRLDKYLQVSRLVKRRTLAKELCDAGRVQINGRVAKAGAEVKEGDVIHLAVGMRWRRVEVLAVDQAAGRKGLSFYRLLEEGRMSDLPPGDNIPGDG